MMKPVPTRPARFGAGAGTLATIVTLAMLFAMPARGAASDPSGRGALLGEFNLICYELSLARASLARGEMHDDAFADRILDLFVRADSLATLLSADPAQARRDVNGFALDRAVRYLIDSLRDNYVGIEGRNGVSFLEADQALKAAVAWRSGASPAVSPH